MIKGIPIYYKELLPRDYLLNFSRLGKLYHYNPHDRAAFSERYRYIQDKDTGNRDALVNALRLYNTEVGSGEKTFANLELLANPKTAVVITGQQAGILTGPLYTIYKAIGTCLLAEKLSREMSVPVTPVFWVGEEDHDFDEINHVTITTAGGPQKLRLKWLPSSRNSTGYTQIPGEIVNLLEELHDSLPPVPDREFFFEQIKNTLGCSLSFGDWFARLMAKLFETRGLILASPLIPALRRLSGDIFRQAVLKSDELAGAITLAEKQVTNLGFKPQLKVEEGRLPLFIYHNENRTALFKAPGCIHTRKGEKQWSPDDILNLINTAPEKFSPGVALRPVVQDELFPVIAYMAGPGEISYYAMLKNLYEAMGRKMPVIYPRPNVTIIEPLINKHMVKHSLEARDFLDGEHDVARRILESSDGIDIKEIFLRFRTGITNQYKNLAREITPVDPSLKQLSESNLRLVMQQVDYMEKKVLQRQRQRHETSLRQLKRIEDHILPDNKWQERVYNIYPFLVKHPDLIERLCREPLLEGHEHKVCLL